VSRTALGPTRPPIQWVPGALSLGVKQPGREADQSPPSSAKVKECVDLYLHSSNTPSWRGAQLKHRDNFTFTFTNSGTSPDRSVGIVTSLRAGRSEFDSRRGLGIFIFATASRPALRPTQPPIEWVAGGSLPRDKAVGA
jgi:hypothetical protein